jgi:hypothetical protein
VGGLAQRVAAGCIHCRNAGISCALDCCKEMKFRENLVKTMLIFKNETKECGAPPQKKKAPADFVENSDAYLISGIRKVIQSQNNPLSWS